MKRKITTHAKKKDQTQTHPLFCFKPTLFEWCCNVKLKCYCEAMQTFFTDCEKGRLYVAAI